VTQQRSLTLDTALCKYTYGSLFTIHHAVVLFCERSLSSRSLHYTCPVYCRMSYEWG